MKAKITIEKTFDNGKQFSKNYESGDFKEFFSDEGGYLDKLADIVNTHGKKDDGFTITYTVTLEK